MKSLEFYRKTLRKARFEYTCWRCKLIIRKNEKHYDCAGKHEGQFFSVRECIVCADLSLHL